MLLPLPPPIPLSSPRHRARHEVREAQRSRAIVSQKASERVRFGMGGSGLRDRANSLNEEPAVKVAAVYTTVEP